MPDTSFTAQQTTILAAWLNQVNLAIFQGRSPNVGTTTGSANAQVLTLATGSLYTSRTAGDTFGFIAGYTNAAAATLQVVAPGGTLPAAALELNGAALTGGEVIAGQPYVVAWDGTAWQLISLAGTVFGTSLLQTADATAARAALAAAGTATTITGSGLVTGGGDLSANRVLTVAAATQAEQETGSSTAVAVTPGRQKYHQSAAKAWVSVNSSGSIFDSFGVTSVTDTGTGQATVNFSTDFANANYCTVQSCEGGSFITSCTTIAVGSVLLRCFTDGGSLQDPSTYFAAFFGDQ